MPNSRTNAAYNQSVGVTATNSDQTTFQSDEEYPPIAVPVSERATGKL